jgi:hypothetical protein
MKKNNSKPILRVLTALLLSLSVCVAGSSSLAAEVLVEAEVFAERGGWVVDPQFMDIMGSPYLLAHGLGKPVANAKTEMEFPEPGSYRLWVRTMDWVPSHHPGRFKVVVAGTEVAATFGEQGAGWVWQDGGSVEIKEKTVAVELKDLTGFDGRCDALFFTTDRNFTPPAVPDAAMAAWRRKLLRLPEAPPAAGTFDVVVVGGGIPGCAAALTAARLGLSVALIQDRPVLGGNGSTEIGIHPRDGSPDSRVSLEVARGDREKILRAEKTLKLFLGWRAFRVQKNGNRIASVDARSTCGIEELRFTAPVFIDSTGLGTLGLWAGAEYRLGREAKAEFNEGLAPVEPDKMHHGNTVVFRTRLAKEPKPFPDVPWATEISKDYGDLRGLSHFWEYGQFLDPFKDAEHVRDHLLCAIYGTFSTVKRLDPEKNANLELAWVGYVAASGEALRLMGDYMLTENDIRSQKEFPDAVARCTGHICLHFPGKKYDFRLGDWKWIPVQPYSVPFRCLYSRNVENLMMACKCISVSHIAGCSTKTMLNGAEFGVATAAAAYLCKKHDTPPRGVYQKHLAELQDIVFERGEHANDLKPAKAKQGTTR